MELADNDKPYYGNNFLIGSDNDTITFAYGNSLFYKLSYGPSNTDLSGVPGWYWGARNGGEFPIEGHKAWLAIPVSLTKGSNGYSMTGTPTYANEIPADIFDEEAVIYDLNGIRQLTPIGNGMSIINGKVVIIIE